MRISEEQLLLTIFYEIRYFNASDDILRNTETTIFQEYNSCVVSLQGKRGLFVPQNCHSQRCYS